MEVGLSTLQGVSDVSLTTPLRFVASDILAAQPKKELALLQFAPFDELSSLAALLYPRGPRRSDLWYSSASMVFPVIARATLSRSPLCGT